VFFFIKWISLSRLKISNYYRTIRISKYSIVTYSYWKFLINCAWVHICVKCRSQRAPLVNCSL